MLANITTRREQVMDARSGGRFVGTEPEPRPGLRGGHIPGAGWGGAERGRAVRGEACAHVREGGCLDCARPPSRLK